MEAQVKTIGKPRQYKGEAQVSQRRSPCLTIEAHILQYILTLTIDHLIEFCLQYQIRYWFGIDSGTKSGLDQSCILSDLECLQWWCLSWIFVWSKMFKSDQRTLQSRRHRWSQTRLPRMQLRIGPRTNPEFGIGDKTLLSDLLLMSKCIVKHGLLLLNMGFPFVTPGLLFCTAWASLLSTLGLPWASKLPGEGVHWL